MPCAELCLRVLLPWLIMAIVDQALGSAPPTPWILALPGVTPGDRASLLVAIVGLGFAIQMAHQGVLMAHARLHSVTAHLITRDLRTRLFAHLQGLNLPHHVETPIDDSVYRLQQDGLCLEQLLLRGLLPLTIPALTLIVMFTILLQINVPLALVAMSVVPFLFVWIRWSARRIGPAPNAPSCSSRG